MAPVGSFVSFASIARCHPCHQPCTVTPSESSLYSCSCFPKGPRELGASLSSRVTILHPSKSSVLTVRSSKQIEKLGKRELRTENGVVEMALPAQSERLISPAVAESVRRVSHEASEQTKLPHGLDMRFLPNHVAIIMDGNARWAERKGLPPHIGHAAGVQSLKEVIRLSCLWGIRALTVFAFSTDNWNRSEVEVANLMQLFQKELKKEVEILVKENIQIRFIGNIRGLPVSLQVLLIEAERVTRQNNGLKFTVAISYSGRNDIVQACRRIATKIQKEEINPDDITESLMDDEVGTSWIGAARNPDLLIRTSGEKRLSNFLLWQLAYTELFFLDAYWPDVGELQFANALLSYQRRNRRYGRRSIAEAL